MPPPLPRLPPPQDLASTAIAGGELPDEQTPEEMVGDYSWDAEYNFDLLVSLTFFKHFDFLTWRHTHVGWWL